jgi:hypothetical protein
MGKGFEVARTHPQELLPGVWSISIHCRAWVFRVWGIRGGRMLELIISTDRDVALHRRAALAGS